MNKQFKKIKNDDGNYIITERYAPRGEWRHRYLIIIATLADWAENSAETDEEQKDLLTKYGKEGIEYVVYADEGEREPEFARTYAEAELLVSNFADGDDVTTPADTEPLTGDVSRLYGGTKGLYGECAGLSGDVSELYGDCSGISGDVTGLEGCCDGIYGDVTGLAGDCTYMEGNCTGLTGDCEDIIRRTK